MSRIRIRPVSPADNEATRPWLPEAIAAVLGRDAVPDPGLTLDAARAAWDAALPPGDAWVAMLAGDGAVGLARVRTGDGGGTLIVDALAVRRDARNLGYGQELVFALEQQYRAPLGFAGVPRTNGLAVYFWLRAGYHPSFPPVGDEPTAPVARLWMRRLLPGETRSALAGPPATDGIH